MSYVLRSLGGLFLKLNFEKAYDRLNCDFLEEVLVRKGFSQMMVHRLMQLVKGGQTMINVDGRWVPSFAMPRGGLGWPIIPNHL
jgi:hypothetical protein